MLLLFLVFGLLYNWPLLTTNCQNHLSRLKRIKFYCDCPKSLGLTVSNYDLEEEAREYVNLVHIEDVPVDQYNLPEPHQQENPEAEIFVEETPVEETPDFYQADLNNVPAPPVPADDESVSKPAKKTYASIVCTVFALFPSSSFFVCRNEFSGVCACI